GRINNSSPWVLPFDSNGGVRVQAEVLEAHWIRVLVVYGAENGRWCRTIDLECGVGRNRKRVAARKLDVIRDVDDVVAGDYDIVAEGAHFIVSIAQDCVVADRGYGAAGWRSGVCERKLDVRHAEVQIVQPPPSL